MAPKDKSYYALTETDGAPAAEEFGRSVPVLPQALAPYAHVSLDISDDLAKYAAVGQLHSVVLRFRVSGATELDRLRFTLNGKDLPQEPTCLRRINELYRMTAPRYREPPRYCWHLGCILPRVPAISLRAGVNNSYWYVFELVHFEEHWPRPGPNPIGVISVYRDERLASSIALELRDVELDIQYLAGRAWHRGQDPALGPSNISDPVPKL